MRKKVEKVSPIFVWLWAYVACFTSCREEWEPFVDQTGVGAHWLWNQDLSYTGELSKGKTNWKRETENKLLRCQRERDSSISIDSSQLHMRYLTSWEGTCSVCIVACDTCSNVAWLHCILFRFHCTCIGCCILCSMTWHCAKLVWCSGA